MTDAEQAGYEASLTARHYRPEDVPPEEPARSEWLRGWERGHVAVEACVDVVREVMHAYARAEVALDALHTLSEYGTGTALPSDERKRVRAAIEANRDEAWRRVRPALRALIAVVREGDASAMPPGPIVVTGDGESRRTTMRAWCPETRRTGTLTYWIAPGGTGRRGAASFWADDEPAPDPTHEWTRARALDLEDGGTRLVFDGVGEAREWHRRSKAPRRRREGASGG